MARLLPRYRRDLEPEERQRVERVVEVEPVTSAMAGGDKRRLRGIPVVGRGVGGTSPGTDPYAALDRTSWYPAQSTARAADTPT